MQACLQGCPSSIKKKLVVHYFLLNEYLAPKFGKRLVIWSKKGKTITNDKLLEIEKYFWWRKWLKELPLSAKEIAQFVNLTAVHVVWTLIVNYLLNNSKLSQKHVLNKYIVNQSRISETYFRITFLYPF